MLECALCQHYAKCSDEAQNYAGIMYLTLRPSTVCSSLDLYSTCNNVPSDDSLERCSCFINQCFYSFSFHTGVPNSICERMFKN